MKVPGLDLKTLVSLEAQRSPQLTIAADHPFDAKVQMNTAYLAHHGADRSYRPYLRLRGSLVGLVPTEELRAGPDSVIEEITYSPGRQDDVDVSYEFTSAQLVEPVKKGYFEQGFAAPAILSRTVLELPVEADVLVVPGRDPEDVPLIYPSVKNLNDLVYDAVSSGYPDVVAEFDQHQGVEAELEETDLERSARLRDSIFAGREALDVPVTTSAETSLDPDDLRGMLDAVPADEPEVVDTEGSEAATSLDDPEKLAELVERRAGLVQDEPQVPRPIDEILVDRKDGESKAAERRRLMQQRLTQQAAQTVEQDEPQR